jgi:nucleoside-diphosphate-sugar epimerase
MHPPRILLTGASGFVAGALGVHLRRLGYDVTGVSRSPARPGSTDRSITYDLSQPIPPTWPVHDLIVHCAALSSPWAPPASFHASNVIATRNLLHWAQQANVPRFVFISSSSVYYQPGDQLDITEETPFPSTPINHYAATKLAAEFLVRDSGLSTVILRPRAVFGPGDTVLLPRILRAARRGSLPRLVRPDGLSPLADLIYIDNLSHYIERAIATGATGAFNLTNNQPVELYPFLDDLLAQLGLPQPRRSVRIGTAMALARLAELTSQYLFQYKEPPVTRFGVSVMAYSKTFNVSRMIAAFGPPPISLHEGVQHFLQWQRTQ